MKTLHQQFSEHLKKHGCKYHKVSAADADDEIWVNGAGKYFSVPKYCGSNINVNNIAEIAGVPPMRYSQH